MQSESRHFNASTKGYSNMDSQIPSPSSPASVSDANSDAKSFIYTDADGNQYSVSITYPFPNTIEYTVPNRNFVTKRISHIHTKPNPHPSS